MPHSVDMPAPVKTTARLARWTIAGQFFYVSVKHEVIP